MDPSHLVKPVCGLLLLLLLSLTTTSTVQGRDPQSRKRNASEVEEPGLHYGRSDELPLPKTIFFGAGLDNIVADARQWSRRGVTAFFVDHVAREWSTDIWATDGKPWTIGPSDETLQKARKAVALCKEIGSETFLKIAFDHTFEWFNDTAWQKIDNNFRQFAIFARDAGFDGIALDGEYTGIGGGKVRWVEHHQDGSHTSVDLTTVFKPTENVCAYALGYVSSAHEQKVWFRIGTNDSGKVWAGGQLVYDYPHEGQAILDRDVVPVTLGPGATPILVKICNGDHDWGFVFRITDENGKPVKKLRWRVRGSDGRLGSGLDS